MCATLLQRDAPDTRDACAGDGRGTALPLGAVSVVAQCASARWKPCSQKVHRLHRASEHCSEDAQVSSQFAPMTPGGKDGGTGDAGGGMMPWQTSHHTHWSAPQFSSQSQWHQLAHTCAEGFEVIELISPASKGVASPGWLKARLTIGAAPTGGPRNDAQLVAEHSSRVLYVQLTRSHGLPSQNWLYRLLPPSTRI